MVAKNSSLLSCWPDGYSRYYSVTNLLSIVFKKNSIRILDVGGDSEWMSKFLDATDVSYDLTIIDTRKPDFVNKKDNIHYLQKDFFTVDATSFSAEAVINTDVLEHIPANLKEPFIEKCIEIAESVAVFSAPQNHDDVTRAEKQINKNYIDFSGKQQYWLKEHFEFGKPNFNTVESIAESKGLPYITIATNNLENWALSFSINLINSEVVPLDGVDELNRYYNKNIHTVGDFTGNPYRKITIVFKDKKLYESSKRNIEKFFQPDTTSHLDFILKSLQLITDNFSVLSKDYDSTKQKLSDLDREHSLTLKNLRQTQEAYVSVSKELNVLKSSRVYRYLSRFGFLHK
ncbi:MAG TPA: hypothetical protein PLT04_01690 [Candidatus Saccharibacteria bacterium]|nr:hypothetical protein [Candidatus Woesebacteria bacterium]HPR09263.1 hypothetical protein [Candidatus Saccharibacteria bacterium]